MTDITNCTKSKPPSFSYNSIVQSVHGSTYELSLVFIGKTRSRRLNRTYRGKDKPANVLSFAITPHVGELFLTPSLVKNDRDLLVLFIHGLFHLKGMRHGRIMEAHETKTLERYTSYTHNGTPDRNRDRRREFGGARRRRRI